MTIQTCIRTQRLMECYKWNLLVWRLRWRSAPCKSCVTRTLNCSAITGFCHLVNSWIDARTPNQAFLASCHENQLCSANDSICMRRCLLGVLQSCRRRLEKLTSKKHQRLFPLSLLTGWQRYKRLSIWQELSKSVQYGPSIGRSSQTIQSVTN